MNTIENHLLPLNLGAGGSRDGLQGVVGTLSSRLPPAMYHHGAYEKDDQINEKYDQITLISGARRRPPSRLLRHIYCVKRPLIIIMQ